MFRTADVLSLDAFIAREAASFGVRDDRSTRTLKPAEQFWIWREAAAASLREYEHEAGTGLLTRDSLSDALRRAEELAFDYRLDIDASIHGAEASLLRATSRRVYEHWRRLDALPPERILARAEHVPVGELQARVLFCGFDEITPRLREYVAKQRAAGRPMQIETTREPRACARIVRAADATEELDRIAQWCAERLSAKPASKLLIVAPGAPVFRERLAFLVRQALSPRASLDYSGIDSTGQAVDAVSIEGGEPLAIAPIVATALTTLDLLVEGLEHEAFSRWLRSPYAGERDPLICTQLDEGLHERLPLHVDIETACTALASLPESKSETTMRAAHALRAALISAGEALFGPGPTREAAGSLREWSERFARALAILGWPRARVLDSGEQQSHIRFAELLGELGEISALAPGAVGSREALTLLRAYAMRVPFRPAAEDAAVTITASTGDPIVRYDGIWVAGLHAGHWPPAPQPDPFLPIGAQRDARVPQASGELQMERARASQRAWQAATDELVLSSPARIDDLDQEESLLLRELGIERDVSALAAPIWLPRRAQRSIELDVLAPEQGSRWDVEEQLPGGTRSLELQNVCAFRAYAELRLGAARRAARSPGVEPDQRGRWLHRTLQLFWIEVADSARLAMMSSDEVLALARRCAREVFEPVPQGMKGSRATRSATEREMRRCARLVARLAELERSRAPFQVIATESSRTLVLGGARLEMRVDRIDRIGTTRADEGGTVIIDYKSGRTDRKADWDGERPTHPQLLAYATALGDDVVAVATASIGGADTKFDGIAATSGLLPKVTGITDWPSRLHAFAACVTALAGDFMAGRTDLNPARDACKRCHVTALCRVTEWQGFAQEPDEGDDASHESGGSR